MIKNNHVLLSGVACIFCYCLMAVPLLARAEMRQSLPNAIQQQLGQPLQTVGSGRYTKFGFTIYHATLWSSSGQWKPDEPYVLQLRYARDLSQSTLVEAVVDGISEQEVADKETLERWNVQLKEVLPEVREDDELVGLSVPGLGSFLYFNGKMISNIREKALSDAFFGIWFGKKADNALREALTGR